MSGQEQIRRRHNGGGGGGGNSDDFDGLGLEVANVGVDEVMSKLDNDLQNLNGLISKVYGRITQKQRPSRTRGSCVC